MAFSAKRWAYRPTHFPSAGNEVALGGARLKRIPERYPPYARMTRCTHGPGTALAIHATATALDYLVACGVNGTVRRSTSVRTPIGISLKQNENRRGGAATGPWSYLVVRSRGSDRACSPHSCRARLPEYAGSRQARCDRVRPYLVRGRRPCRDLRFPQR